ncbi:EAL domain-containing protein [Shewanella sp. D64]|uniref:putative bifunctional diguanylate cyclase/phosphodiesterase n=1 Tax=unclassified Shewanella TaxID=196818 RepID=UPI0022BA28AC|nr:MULTISPECIES: GGDEF domain-containing phosphodiesterase [unclassified Shewanella]MEC4726628.1 EAL domain-containing protein [Shewanella sp. D64]MEC4739008.1 EAL domain-containing protein [Shewanella sp. E94]WBJ96845.1 EAL domain-containing protein [Shewanella sp. MTB7]
MMNEDKIRAIIHQLSDLKYANFANNICIGLTKAIEADFVFIASLNSDKTVATTIALANNDNILDNFSYPLRSTPCTEVIKGGICSLAKNAQHLYPDDKLLAQMDISGYVGISLQDSNNDTTAILVALFHQPITNSSSIESLFLLFSGLIEKDIETQDYIKRLNLSDHIIDESKEAIFISNNRNQIVRINEAFTKTTGYSLDEVYGKNPKMFNSGDHSQQFYEQMWSDIKHKGGWSGEIWNKRKNNEVFPELLTISVIHDAAGEISHYVGSFFDISESVKAKKKIQQQASFDLLTGLANRFFFMETLTKKIKYLKNNKSQPTVYMMDLDLFKEINDLFGEQFGDQLLIKAAERLQSLIKSSDIAARISGDGFALMVNHIANKADMLSLADKITQAFREPFYIQETSIDCRLSIGITHLSEKNKDASSVMKEAEHAMYYVKNNGRDSYRYFTSNMQDEVLQRIELKNDLQNAICNKQLHLVYQPIFSTKSLVIEKFEVLVRWEHNGILISPEIFIPLAEEFMLIKDIGEFVLQESCAQLKRLKSKGFTEIGFNVNRSVYEIPFNERDNDQWLSTINQHQLAPSDICFELTESALASERSNNERLLKHLQDAGCTIALDDFGTGYSSLSYLRRFPIDIIKIDRSFIKDMTVSQDAHILVSTIISMAKALGKTVVAEGVETQEQLHQLIKLDCDFIQGYYLSKPISAQEILPYLTNNTLC